MQPRTGAAAKQRLAIRHATENLENTKSLSFGEKCGLNICNKNNPANIWREGGKSRKKCGLNIYDKKYANIWREGEPGQARSNYDANAVEHL